MKKQCLLLATLLSFQLMAQPSSPVVELNSSGYSDAKKKPTASDIQRAEQFYQMQVLKDEVKMLRGKVEELSYDLQQLKQLQMDDYLDIDRRLTVISASKATLIPTNNNVDSIFIAPEAQLTAQTLQPEVSAPIIVTPEDIEADYLASSKLLKERDFEGAIADYTKMIEIAPRDGNGYINRAVAKYLNGDLQGACLDSKEAKLLGFNNKRNES